MPATKKKKRKTAKKRKASGRKKRGLDKEALGRIMAAAVKRGIAKKNEPK